MINWLSINSVNCEKDFEEPTRNQTSFEGGSTAIIGTGLSNNILVLNE